MMAVSDLVAVGMDVGGTATRVLVVDAQGYWRGSGRAGGGNPTAHTQHVSSEAIRRALGQALAEAGPAKVASVVVGVAGDAALADSDVAASFKQTIRAEVGGDSHIQVTGDTDIAFAAGTPGPDGSILIAGTGAAAAAIRGRSLVTRTDGHGWLLGDAGSGFWLGRKAVRAALADLDGRGPETRLRPLIMEALLGEMATAADSHTTCLEMVRTVHAHPPVGLSRLAPLVSECASQGDDVALDIALRAADHLISAVDVVRSPGETTPLVVTGGVAVGNHIIAGMLRKRLEGCWPACVHPVSEAVLGAAWLALKALPGIDEEGMTRLHRVLAR